MLTLKMHLKLRDQQAETILHRITNQMTMMVAHTEKKKSSKT